MISALPLNERPRERLLKYGEEVLSTRELLAILLGSGTRKYPVLELAGEILQHFQGSLLLLAKASCEELQKIPGIGPAKALELRAAFALAMRLSQEKIDKKISVKSPELLASFLQAKMRSSPQEEFHIVVLNPHLEIIQCEKVSHGLIDRCLVHAREVFRHAISLNGSSIIIAHNHPSGKPLPSEEDIIMTRKLYQAGQIIGIPLLDHIIVGEKSSRYPKGYTSFREECLPPFKDEAAAGNDTE